MALIDELKEKIIETLDLRDIKADSIGPDTSFWEEGLNLDSIDILELAVMIEEDYNVIIDNQELGEKVFITIGTLIQFIEENSTSS